MTKPLRDAAAEIKAEAEYTAGLVGAMRVPSVRAVVANAPALADWAMRAATLLLDMHPLDHPDCKLCHRLDALLAEWEGRRDG